MRWTSYLKLLVVIVVAVFPILLVTSSIALINTSPTSSASTLRELAARLGIHIGSAVSYSALTSDAQYAHILGQQFSAITPENEMKWVSVEAQQGVYDFAQADAEVQFAQHQHQLVRGHNLVWFEQLPTWLTGGTFTKAQLAAILQQHIATEVGHFRGDIWQWDVVNEPFNDDGTLRNTLWLNALGSDYIADALRWAHQADPNAKLFLNDYNIEGIGAKSDAMYALVKGLLAQHVPIDGVGFETHLDLQFGLPPMIKENLQRFAALGLDVDITEMDVRMSLPATSDDLTAQANVYAQLMQDCIAVPRCVDFTVWEYTDAYSWVPNAFAGEGAADIYDNNLAPKPAYDALIQALQEPVAPQVHGH
ncbi:MAG TPA: endo-1,4-beta-xylanase [Ktedonobacterales bacterium]|nr:endo-1,4-beta-xylanase [Ktedonobacterales bacterium]